MLALRVNALALAQWANSLVACRRAGFKPWCVTELPLLSLPRAAGEWVSVEGRFRAVSLTCMSSSCPRSPLGLSPSAHLADGTGDLIIVRDTHPLGFLTFLHRHTSTQDQVKTTSARPQEM